MAQPQVILLSAGHLLSEGLDSTTGQRRYIDAVHRPDLTAVDLPALGDSWSIDYPGVRVVKVDTTPLNGDASAGNEYVVDYSTSTVSMDPIGPLGGSNTSISISCDASFDSYSHDPEHDGDAYFIEDDSVFTKIEDALSVSRLTPHMSVQVTSRYTGTINTILSEMPNSVGKVNNAVWRGIPIGCVLYLGSTATPIKEPDGASTSVKWNRTYNFSIRILPGVNSDTWNCIFYKGKYGRLSTSNSSSGYAGKNLYEYATIPDPIGSL